MPNLLSALSDQEIVTIESRAEQLWKPGMCCPRRCHTAGGNPPCLRLSEGIKVASFAVHDGEEPPISGWNGAGNVFLSGCNLKCLYCQNWPISHNNNGGVYSVAQFADKLLALQKKCVHNLNFVTPDHYLYPIVSALFSIRHHISVPVVWNCSGYFVPEALDIVRSFADIFLLDVKYAEDEPARLLSAVSDYPERILEVLHSFVEHPLVWREDESGLLTSGLIVRHLVLPGYVENSLKVLDMLNEFKEMGLEFKLSLMSQYFPAFKAFDIPGMDREVTAEEYTFAVERAKKYEFDGWIQQSS